MVEHAVMLRGLPPKAAIIDILNFFCDLDVDKNAIELRRFGRNGVEAVVNLRNAEEVEEAMRLDKSMFGPKFGQRFVRVVPLVEETPASESTQSLASFSRKRTSREASSSGSSNTAPVCSVVRIDGLPDSISKEDVQHLFWGTELQVSDIKFISNDGADVYALVNFSTGACALDVVKRWNGTMITTAQGSFRLQLSFPSDLIHVMNKEEILEHGILKMRGLPIRIEEREIASFFYGCEMKKNGGIHLQKISDNRHSKLAYVEFINAQEAKKALEKDHCCLGGEYKDRYCLLQPATRMEMEADLLRFSSRTSANQRQGNGVQSSRLASAFPRFMNTPRGGNVMFLQSEKPPVDGHQIHPGYFQRVLYPPFLAQPCSVDVACFPWLNAQLQGFPNNRSQNVPVGASTEARYYVKDLQTGKSLYLNPNFAPANDQGRSSPKRENHAAEHGHSDSASLLRKPDKRSHSIQKHAPASGRRSFDRKNVERKSFDTKIASSQLKSSDNNESTVSTYDVVTQLHGDSVSQDAKRRTESSRGENGVLQILRAALESTSSD